MKRVLVLIGLLIALTGCNKEVVVVEPQVIDVETITVPLVINQSGGYLNIEIPICSEDNGRYPDTDFANYIQCLHIPAGEGPRYTLTVVDSEVAQNTASKLMSSDKKNLSSNVIADGKVIVSVYGDKAVVFITKDRQVYDVVGSSLLEQKELNDPVAGKINTGDITKVLKKLLQPDGYYLSVAMGTLNDRVVSYRLEDGCLTISEEIGEYEDVLSRLITKLNAISPMISDTVYQTDNVTYVRNGEFTIAITKINFNTQKTFFAYGLQGRNNIIDYLHTFEQEEKKID